MSLAVRQHTVRYQRQLQIEPYGVEVIPQEERQKNSWSQLTLWFGCNLTIADFALGFLPVSLGLPLWATLAALLLGNVVGSLLVGALASMGPKYGLPQLVIGRFSFGIKGEYLPAAFNFLSTVGWFAVNNILGTFGLQTLLPGIPFFILSLGLVVIQGVVAILGHHFIHIYERIMSIVLGVLFLVVSVRLVQHSSVFFSYHPHPSNVWPLFAIMAAATFSYVGSWAPYASDYSRYLKNDTSSARIVSFAAIGNFLSSFWLELVGLGVALLAKNSSNSIAALHSVMGSFGDLAVIAIILGGTAADALNLYSNALSALAIDIRLPRSVMTVITCLLGLILSWIGAGSFENNYENFLLLLGYWITPWVGVLLADFWKNQFQTRTVTSLRLSRLLAFIIGILVSIPFMSSSLYEGPIAKALGGTDLTFIVGFLVAFTLTWFLPKES
ncbi:allantoin permease [Alicyclobacillus sp. TC]|nr:allantoin permease [Alicyclobacillus sp. TC]